LEDVMERDEQPAAVSKSPASVGTINTLPHDDDAVAQVIGPVLHRIDPAAATTQALIITADADVALDCSRAATAAGHRIVPATSEGRTRRLLRLGAVPALAAPPGVLVSLMRDATLKLGDVRVILLAWADEILEAGEGDALDTLMAELPKEVARVLVTNTLSPAVEALAERYFRRAHRLSAPPVPEGLAPVTMSYVPVSDATRSGALRRVLDELDPPSVSIIVRTERAASEARIALRELGYPEGDPNIAITTGSASADVSLIVLYEMPASAEHLRSTVGAGTPRIVALARPRDLARLGALAGAMPTPLPPREATERARRAEAAMRDELRAELQRGAPDRQIVALEPLLDEFDGIAIAGAALRLLERARQRRPEVHAAPSPGAKATANAAFVRLFMTVGSRDNVGPGDLVGMITAEGGITSAEIGKIDIRDNHSLVEVAATVAEKVAAKISGSAVKGRRVVARLERNRDERAARGGERPRERSDAPRGGRGDRPRTGERDRPRTGERDRPRPGFGGDRGPQRGPSRPSRDEGSEGRAPRGAAPPRRDG
jgi:ATP-dependent RNA helicase DeaD